MTITKTVQYLNILTVSSFHSFLFTELEISSFVIFASGVRYDTVNKVLRTAGDIGALMDSI